MGAGSVSSPSMGKPISSDYMQGRKLLTGVLDPSGLKLVFEADSDGVATTIEATETFCGRAKEAPPGNVQAAADDVAHATAAHVKKRVGMTREARVRYLKPLYVGDRIRATGAVIKEKQDIFVVQVKLTNKKGDVCVEAEVEIFALAADQLRRMSPDGIVAPELKKYLP